MAALEESPFVSGSGMGEGWGELEKLLPSSDWKKWREDLSREGWDGGKSAELLQCIEEERQLKVSAEEKLRKISEQKSREWELTGASKKAGE